MVNTGPDVASLSSAQLLEATHHLVRDIRAVEADLLVHLAEIDERKLYLERRFPSMFAFCCDELGFSEDAAYNRIFVARAGRRLPAIFEALRSGAVHLAGLRLLAPVLTPENHELVLKQAAGKSKREIDVLVACLVPRPAVAAFIRRLPDPVLVQESFRSAATSAFVGGSRPGSNRPVIAPLSAETFMVQFTASRSFKEKLERAQGLMRRRVPDGDMATILERALDVLIERVEKERFCVGRKPRRSPETNGEASSRHIPDAIRRAVYERDGGRCTFTDDQSRRCEETEDLEVDHIEGYARTRCHDLKGLRLVCRAHNQYYAEKMYGREFMEAARQRGKSASTCPGTSSVPDPAPENGGGVAPIVAAGPVTERPLNDRVISGPVGKDAPGPGPAVTASASAGPAPPP